VWRWNTMLSIWLQKQMTKFPIETGDTSKPLESSHVEITTEDTAHHFLRCQGYYSLWIQSTRQSTKLINVEILKRLREAVHRKRPELWPNDWILHHDNDPAHKALSVKQFLPQISITKIKHSPYSPYLAPNDLLPFPKIKSSLKGTIVAGYWRHPINVTVALKDVPQQEFQKCLQQWQHRWARYVGAQGGVLRRWHLSVKL
jgi:hypothetical protein